MSRVLKLVMCLTTAVLIVTTNDNKANADVIAGWDFDGIQNVQPWGPSPMPPTESDANVVVEGWTRGPGVTTSGTAASNAWGGNGWNGTTDVAGAIAAGDYATFTVAADPGFALSLTGFDAYNIRRSSTGPSTGQWQYSLDGSNFTDIGAPITWGSTTSASGNLQTAIDLSGISELQNITSTVTFRIANWNSTSSAGTWYHNNFQTGNDLILNGSIVPEPSTIVLMAGVGFVVLGLKRLNGSRQ